jgi:hypothetical protein
MKHSVIACIVATTLGSYTNTYAIEAPPTALRMGEERVSYTQRYDNWIQTIPEEHHAWPIFESVYNAMSDSELTTQELLRSHPELVLQLHEVLNCTTLGMPTAELGDIENEDAEDVEILLGVLLPHAVMIRSIANLLILDAEQCNDPERVILDLQALQFLNEHLSIMDSMIEGLVMATIDSMMYSLVFDDKLELETWDTKSLERLADVYNTPSHWKPTTRFIQSERAMQENFLDWIYVDSVDGRLSLRGAKRYFRLSTDDPNQEPNEHTLRALQDDIGPRSIQAPLFDMVTLAAIKDLTEPIAGRDAFTSVVVRVADQLDPDKHGLKYGPVGTMLPATDRFIPLMLEKRTERHAAMLTLSAYRYRAAFGAFPRSVFDIEKDLLPEAPIDPYTNNTLQLKIQDERIIVYSLGPDLDDDQGLALKEHRFVLRLEYEEFFDEQERAEWDGDWVFTTSP